MKIDFNGYELDIVEAEEHYQITDTQASTVFTVRFNTEQSVKTIGGQLTPTALSSITVTDNAGKTHDFSQYNKIDSIRHFFNNDNVDYNAAIDLKTE